MTARIISVDRYVIDGMGLVHDHSCATPCVLLISGGRFMTTSTIAEGDAAGAAPCRKCMGDEQ